MIKILATTTLVNDGTTVEVFPVARGWLVRMTDDDSGGIVGQRIYPLECDAVAYAHRIACKDIGPPSPGPWRCMAGSNGEFTISCESGGFAPLARVRGDKRSTLKNAEANAQLMAAAPDLLAALYAMLAANYDPELTQANIVQSYDMARGAIAKAEGYGC